MLVIVHGKEKKMKKMINTISETDVKAAQFRRFPLRSANCFNSLCFVSKVAVSELFGELKEFFHRHTRVFNNAFERPTINFFVIRDNKGLVLGYL